MEKLFREFTLKEMCENCLSSTLTPKRTVRIILKLIDDQMKENDILLKDLEDAGLQEEESWEKVMNEMRIFTQYRQWAEVYLYVAIEE